MTKSDEGPRGESSLAEKLITRQKVFGYDERCGGKTSDETLRPNQAADLQPDEWDIAFRETEERFRRSERISANDLSITINAK